MSTSASVRLFPAGSRTPTSGTAMRDEIAALLSGAEQRNELQTSMWRLVVLAILTLILLLEDPPADRSSHIQIFIGYGVVSLIAMVLALADRFRPWLNWLYVIFDALLIVCLLAEHAFAPSQPLAAALATPSLAVAFVLLSHASLRLRPALVATYGLLVVGGWIMVAAIALVGARGGVGWMTVSFHELTGEFARIIAFAAATAIQVFIVLKTRRLLLAALAAGRERANLARFFAPGIVDRLATAGGTVGLRRQKAAILFVDIRGFTSMSEEMEPEEIAALLAEYRGQVTDTIFSRGGTVDKFIGDGVMAVWGFPQPKADDAERAFRCAIDVTDRLALWSKQRRQAGSSLLEFGIGLHYGDVIGGVIPSGCHSEYTVIGDTVNVADRLQRLSSRMGVRIAISGAVASRIENKDLLAGWEVHDSVTLDGRVSELDVHVLPRTA
ncbi:MAG TPA: adenylate/guanylate cyclase domain-containing protein [Microvirga sp.]|nr:adenylate/guanylate cyclase domain-containing protein [Microvirga sp.]